MSKKHKKKIDRRQLLADPNLRRLAASLLGYRRWIALAVAFMMVSAATSSLIAVLLGKLTDAGFYASRQDIVLFVPAGLIAIALANGGAMFGSAYFLQKASQEVLCSLRSQMLERILHWPLETFHKYPAGFIVAKFVNDISKALSLGAEVLTTSVRDCVKLVGLLAVLLWSDWRLTAVILVIGPVLFLTIRFISERIRKFSKQSFDATGIMTEKVSEDYAAHSAIKIYEGYSEELRRFDLLNGQVLKANLRETFFSKLSTPAAHLVTIVGVSIVIVVALLQVQSGQLTIGGFVTYLSALLLLSSPIRHLANIFGTLSKMGAAADAVYGLLDEPLEPEGGTVQLPRLRGQIRFEHVCKRYQGSETAAVSDFCLTVEPGETVALVGASGAGKTTVINLVPRFLVPDSGRILFDGTDAAQATLTSLRASISLVGQHVLLFDGTIAENIAYGVPGPVSPEQIREAARQAHLLEFIDSLPEGFDTQVGERGTKLSGGQRQRISIARALIKNAPILLLDEATSALDNASEKAVQASLEGLMRQCTTLVVAHRLSTIVHADRIQVMSDGRIVESGTHAALLAKGGAYAALYTSQFGS